VSGGWIGRDLSLGEPLAAQQEQSPCVIFEVLRPDIL
jgi:hypothetical protein